MITGILIAVLLVFGVYIYKFPPTKRTSTPCPCSDKICMDYSTPMSDLSVDLIHTMVNKYRGKQLNCINALNDFKEESDAHSIWFDLETLKKFIYNIEKQSKNKGLENNEEITSKELGIRVYYAAYPEIKDWGKYDDLISFQALNPITNKYGHLHTLVMIPTRSRGGKTFDFNPLDYDTYANGLYDRSGYHYNYANTRTAALLIAKMDDGTDPDVFMSAQNHGQLFPPDIDYNQIFNI
ncbi:hypothetical protein LXD69_10470 [Flavobacterium sediminilitoris]|uniref:Uncharacterized protein n=1 Tax=Flavobacterium sediminilitoris TaxID=2024526 RepID=A0ABY4HI16_9FLAO|nr:MULTISPECIES: hypothetical protein [Flavobacterium]UOX32475.1 hypothetical protein LXD69_10470 [Flavobacterium sediminilitoris]